MQLPLLLFVPWTVFLSLQAVNGNPQHSRQSELDEPNLISKEILSKRSVTLKPRQNTNGGQAATTKLKIDYCQLVSVGLNNKKKISIAMVRNCYKSFQYDKAQASQTVQTVSQLLDMYAFLDYNNGKKALKIDPDKKYRNEREKMEAAIDDSQVDVSSGYHLKAAVEKVEKGKYGTDFEFQEALASALIPARDGHLVYRPRCYRTFKFIQPIYLTSRLRNLKLEVMLGGIDSQITKPESKYLGSTVVHIDGVETLKYLVKYAKEEYGRCRSAPTRFAKVVTTITFDPIDGNFRYERGDFARRVKVPDNDSVTYGIRNSATGKVDNVTVSWILESPPGFEVSNSQDYWNKYCKGDSSLHENAEVLAALEVEKGEPLRNLVVDAGQEFVNKKGKTEKNGVDIENDITPIVRATGLGFFILEENKAQFGVISVPDFDVKGPEIAKWTSAMIEGLNTFKAKKINKIFVDFSNNGGGNVCVAYALSRVLSIENILPTFPYPDKILDSRVRMCKPLEMLCEASFKAKQNNLFTPGYFNCIAANGALNKCPDHMTWGDLKAAEKEELRLRKSAAIIDRCPKDDLAALEPLQNYKIWTSDVYLLTNGYCGSACATALAMLRYQDHLVVHFHHKPPCFGMSNQECNSKAPFSFAGGQVVSSDGLFTIAKKLGLLGKQGFPKPFKINAEFMFAYRALIDRQYPLDLMHWDRNYIMLEPGYSQVMRIDKRWKEAFKIVDKYATKRKPLLELRKELRDMEKTMADVEADYNNFLALYNKKFKECEENVTQACVDEIDTVVNKLNEEIVPKHQAFIAEYNAKVKELMERSKKESQEFGKDWK